jgi:hypothetical protein
MPARPPRERKRRSSCDDDDDEEGHTQPRGKQESLHVPRLPDSCFVARWMTHAAAVAGWLDGAQQEDEHSYVSKCTDSLPPPPDRSLVAPVLSSRGGD